MRVFKYWSRVWQDKKDQSGFHFSLCRVAGSNISEHDAFTRAQQKLFDSIARLNSGESLTQYEYGEHTLTEELVEEIHDLNGERISAITRNRYGALILNTPNILFADIDAQNRSPTFFEHLLAWLGKPVMIKNKAWHLQRVAEFAQANPNYDLIVYETFAGLRIAIASHEFDALDAHADQILSDLGGDPLYQKLCKHQNCFRARLTPKPWRCGLLKPDNRFPFTDELQAEAMAKWQKSYELKSHHFKVCNKIQRFGQGQTQLDPNVYLAIEKVLRVHDAYVLGTNELPLA